MTDTASLDALGIKPVAWLYNCDGDVWAAALEPEPFIEDDWTETPLYSATDLAPLIAVASQLQALCDHQAMHITELEHNLAVERGRKP